MEELVISLNRLLETYQEQMNMLQKKDETIKETDMDKLFERFYTTDQSRSKKTTGLGLTIAKKLTIRMGEAYGRR